MSSSIFPDMPNEAEYKAAEFQINLTISVENINALWSAALRRHYQITHDLTFDEITDCIGPREDPSITDCLAMLALSLEIDGCSISDISVPDLKPAPRPINIKASTIGHPLLDGQTKQSRRDQTGPDLIACLAPAAGDMAAGGVLAIGL